MPGVLSATSLQTIARGCAANPNAVARVCGSVRIRFNEREWQIGLTITDPAFFVGCSPDRVIAEAVLLISDYKKHCPRVVGWALRGDFNPLKVPEHITGGDLQHATSTVARLRAAVLRSRTQTSF
jgi:hypothetical protein